MIFEQYLQLEQTKAERSTKTMILETGAKNESIDTLIDSCDENTLTARVIKGEVFCIYHKHFINLTELSKQVKALYINAGYMGAGFSKLEPKDFVTYSTAKLILKKLFDSEAYTVEIDTLSAAKYFYAEDYIVD